LLVSDASGKASWGDLSTEGVVSIGQDGTYKNIIFTGSGSGPYQGTVTAYCNPNFNGLPLTCGSILCTSIQCNGPINPSTPGGTVFGTTVFGGVTGSGNPAFQASNTVLAQDQTITTHLTGGLSKGYVVTDALFAPLITGGLSFTSLNRGLAINTGPYGGTMFPGFNSGGMPIYYTSDLISASGNHVMSPAEICSRWIRCQGMTGNAQVTLPNASQVHTYINSIMPAVNPNDGPGGSPYRVGLSWEFTVYNDSSGVTGGAIFLNPSLDGTFVVPIVGQANCRQNTASTFFVTVTLIGGGVPADRMECRPLSQTTITALG
jgi:hypothetical protein